MILYEGQALRTITDEEIEVQNGEVLHKARYTKCWDLNTSPGLSA